MRCKHHFRLMAHLPVSSAKSCCRCVLLPINYCLSRVPLFAGRLEHRAFLIIYLLTLPFQIITTGSFLEQGSTPLVVLTAVHAGLVAALFWALLANAIVSLQVVDDGSPSSLIVRPNPTPLKHINLLHIRSRFSCSPSLSCVAPPTFRLTLLWE